MYWERDYDLPKYTFYLLGKSEVSDELLEHHSKLAREEIYDYEQLVGFTAFEQEYLNRGGVRDFVDNTEQAFCKEVGDEYQPVTEINIYSRVDTGTLLAVEKDLNDMDELEQIIQCITETAEATAGPELHLMPC